MLKNELEYQINIIDAQLSRPEIKNAVQPVGALVCRNSSRSKRYYISNSKTKNKLRSFRTTSLGSGDSAEVITYKLNRIHYEQKRALEKDKKLLTRIIHGAINYDFESIKATLPSVYSDVYEYDFVDLEKWSFDESSDPPKSDGPHHITSDGRFLRSKSELIIYESLLGNKIPFRYEDCLDLKDFNGFKTTRYPDFTIRLADGSYLFWEHAGLLNKEAYLQRFAEKIALYQHNNILLGINLVVTVDDSSGQIDMRSIMRVIQNMILPRL